MSPKKFIIPAILCIAGTVLLLVGVRTAQAEKRLRQASAPVTGTVQDYAFLQIGFEIKIAQNTPPYPLYLLTAGFLFVSSSRGGMRTQGYQPPVR